MGEYAKLAGKEIKIGTCEDMYYLRYDQRYMVQAISGSVNPVKDVELIRFRFPWPDEDKALPGGQGKDFDPFRKFPIDGVTAPTGVDHGSVQFSAKNGYLVSLPCPEATPSPFGLKIHKNGYGGAVQLCQNRVKNGKLVPVFQCGGCEYKWRIEEESELEPYIEAIKGKIARNGGMSFWETILERMTIKTA